MLNEGSVVLGDVHFSGRKCPVYQHLFSFPGTYAIVCKHYDFYFGKCKSK